MIAKESKHFARKYSDLSDSEKERIKKFKEICEELISIFNASCIGIVQPKFPLISPKRDYVFKIYNGDTTYSEKVRLKEILEELRSIFHADSIDVVAPRYTSSPKCDYIIKLYSGDTIGYVYDGRYKEWQDAKYKEWQKWYLMRKVF